MKGAIVITLALLAASSASAQDNAATGAKVDQILACSAENASAQEIEAVALNIVDRGPLSPSFDRQAMTARVVAACAGLANNSTTAVLLGVLHRALIRSRLIVAERIGLSDERRGVFDALLMPFASELSFDAADRMAVRASAELMARVRSTLADNGFTMDISHQWLLGYLETLASDALLRSQIAAELARAG